MSFAGCAAATPSGVVNPVPDGECERALEDYDRDFRTRDDVDRFFAAKEGMRPGLGLESATDGLTFWIACYRNLRTKAQV